VAALAAAGGGGDPLDKRGNQRSLKTIIKMQISAQM